MFTSSFLGVDFQEVIFLGMSGLELILVMNAEYNFIYFILNL